MSTQVNFGHSSRTGYDPCFYRDKLYESTSPLLYRTDPNSIYSCSDCLSTLGPRTSARTFAKGNAVSTYTGHDVANSQHLVDIESILSNRNVWISRCKTGKVNDVDVTKFKLQHQRLCNNFLDPLSSRLTYPAQNYRDVAVNRFYNLDRHPQEPIFWDFATNTKLEAKDNFIEELPRPRKITGLPDYIAGENVPCRFPCDAYCKQTQ